MAVDKLAIWTASAMLLALRIVPVFLFAPPFTLLRIPRVIVVLTGLGLAAIMVSAMPAAAQLARVDPGTLVLGGLSELMVGIVPVLSLQLLFGSLYLVGRTIDVQAGFGLAMLIDPATRGQVPMVGTLFAYVAGATFFAMDGHYGLLRYFAASLRAMPVGAGRGPSGLAPLVTYLSTVSIVALGVGGVAIATLLLCDVVVAMLSRTVPQMNALLLGIQVKVAVMFAVIPVTLGVSGALFVRLVAQALDAMPKLR